MGNRLITMPIKDRSINLPPEKPGGEGWLVKNQQQMVSQIRDVRSALNSCLQNELTAGFLHSQVPQTELWGKEI